MMTTTADGPAGGLAAQDGELMMRMAEIGVRSAAMIHDLNNLLQIVMGNLAFVAGDGLDEKASKHLALARFGLERCTRLARRTLKRDGEVTGVIAAPAAIEGMVERLRDACGPGVDLVLGCQDRDLAIAADESELEDALLNLVINAAQAMQGQGRIHICCQGAPADQRCGERARSADTVVLTLEDTGPGIPAAIEGAVLNRFFTTKAAGSGLGLANVRAFMEAAGGTLAIGNRPGAGAVVTLVFPRVRCQAK